MTDSNSNPIKNGNMLSSKMSKKHKLLCVEISDNEGYFKYPGAPRNQKFKLTQENMNNSIWVKES